MNYEGIIEATELLLQIILERKDVKVVRVKGQVELKNPYSGGKSPRSGSNKLLCGNHQSEGKSSLMQKRGQVFGTLNNDINR